MEAPTPVLRPEGWRLLPPDRQSELLKLEFVAKAGSVERVRCPVCPRPHYEPVITREMGNGVRHFIRCPVELRVEVSFVDRQTWRISVETVGKAVRKTMGLSGTFRSLVTGRLWTLGRTSLQGRSREVLFARGLMEADRDPLIKGIGGGQGIVLVPHRAPDASVWPGRVPAIVPLSQVATIEGQALMFDTAAMAELVDEADRVAHLVGGITLTERELDTVISRKVKTESKAVLTDDAIVKAYQIYGNSRDTEEALRAEGYQIDHSTIARKVKKAREAGELQETRDSSSVNRSVASQSRDRKKKVSQYRK